MRSRIWNCGCVITLLGVLFVTGCRDGKPDVRSSGWKRPTQADRNRRFSPNRPWLLTIHRVGDSSGFNKLIDDVTESSIEDEVRSLDWTNTEQLVTLESRHRKLTVRGFTNSTEEWFQLHVVSLEYGKDGNSVLYSRNLAGADEVVEVLTSCFRDDGKWKTMLTWSDQLRPIPARLLPKKMRDDPSRVRSGVRVQPDGS